MPSRASAAGARGCGRPRRAWRCACASCVSASATARARRRQLRVEVGVLDRARSPAPPAPACLPRSRASGCGRRSSRRHRCCAAPRRSRSRRAPGSAVDRPAPRRDLAWHGPPRLPARAVRRGTRAPTDSTAAPPPPSSEQRPPTAASGGAARRRDRCASFARSPADAGRSF